MAEARQAARVSVIDKRGIAWQPDEDFFSISVKVPYPRTLARWAVRSVYRLKNGVKNQLFPANPVIFVAVMLGVALGVTYADRESWWRQGWLAHALWWLDEAMPWAGMLPLRGRVFQLALQASFFGFFILMYLDRFLLRALLHYKGWLYQEPKRARRQKRLLIWGFLLKLLSGRNPMTYSFQGCLPRQPVPSLKDTVSRYLDTVRPLLSEEEFGKVEAQAKAFQSKEGPGLQRYLWLKSWWASHFVTDWWEKYVYHRSRDPICINSNYYIMDGSNGVPTTSQVGRAAFLVHHMFEFKRSLDREELNPQLIRDTVPLCMTQYRRMFGTTRIAGRECDTLKTTADSKHIVVLRRGLFFKLHMFHRKSTTLLSPPELEAQLDDIILSADAILGDAPPPVEVLSQAIADGDEDANSEPRTPGGHLSRPAASPHSSAGGGASSTATSHLKLSPELMQAVEGCVPALTAGNRTRWAQAREEHFSDGINLVTLEAIETAALVLVLEDGPSPVGWSERGRSLLHGNGANRWFDKSFSLVVYPDGHEGSNAEHSWADAPVLAHMMEHVITLEVLNAPYRAEDGRNMSSKWPSVRPGLPRPQRLRWDLSAGAVDAIRDSMVEATELIDDLDLQVVCMDTYGKGFMKNCGVSPDAFVQLALQMAYHRDAGRFAQTYEASMTRLFRDGRTETVRPVSDESVAFVSAMEADGSDGTRASDDEERRGLMKVAADKHVERYRHAMSGKGVDRHLFALYVVSQGTGVDAPFLKTALSRPWRLSTSQQPHFQTNHWKGIRRMVAAGEVQGWVGDNTGAPLGSATQLNDIYSPGGGFGPVADDGYGVSYMFSGEDRLFFHISSKRSSRRTDSSRFHEHIVATFQRLRELFADVEMPTPSGTTAAKGGMRDGADAAGAAPAARATRGRRGGAGASADSDSAGAASVPKLRQTPARRAAKSPGASGRGGRK